MKLASGFINRQTRISHMQVPNRTPLAISVSSFMFVDIFLSKILSRHACLLIMQARCMPTVVEGTTNANYKY